jgi:hypothetical protein
MRLRPLAMTAGIGSGGGQGLSTIADEGEVPADAAGSSAADINGKKMTSAARVINSTDELLSAEARI